jgi:hypothetical protein
MSSANLLGTRIGIDQARALATILKEHPTLKSLCGNRGDETKLNMSKQIGVEGAIMLAPEISDNGALSHLGLSENSLAAAGVQAFCECLVGDARFVLQFVIRCCGNCTIACLVLGAFRIFLQDQKCVL